ncbi:MAG TPA: pyridoxamine 5'-phosphate oxidase family protein [Nitriliruptorales bacterium]
MARELIELDVAECLELVGERGVGRLAVDDGEGPVILPADYLFQGGVLHIRTSSGTKLDAADRRAPASFEVDALPSESERGWSVLLRGRLRRLLAPEGRDGLEPTPTVAGDRHHLIGLLPTSITGRRIGPDVPTATDT